MTAAPCPGCGLVLPHTDGPAHAYIAWEAHHPTVHAWLDSYL